MNEPRPRVSIVVPCFNLGAYLDQALQSVLTATVRDVEIIVVDDGSTDATTRQLFRSLRRPKTRVVQTPNQGLARARNRGLLEARADFVCFLDADDALEPLFFANALNAFDADPALAFVSCWLRKFGDGTGSWCPTSCEFPRLLAEDTVCTAALMRASAVRAVGGFDSQMPLAGYEGWDLAISLVERGLRGKILPEYGLSYRIRRGSMRETCRTPENHERLIRYLVDKHAASYERHLRGVLETIEERIFELERGARPAADEGAGEKRARELERTLRALIAAEADSVEASTLEDANREIALRFGEAGKQGRVLQEPFVNLRDPVECSEGVPEGSFERRLFERMSESHVSELSRRWKDVILGFEIQRRLLEAEIESRARQAPPQAAAPTAIDWGTLRRLEPVSPVWGFDRGQAIDRHYIERFLADHRADIRGRVLEVKDTAYARAYGSDLEATDAVDIATENPNATLIADLAVENSLPEDAYDCFILTQTLHVIYDVERVVQNAFRTLRPGGVLLATMPCVSRIDYESGVDGDCWRFTAASARRLFGGVFPPGNVEIRSCGNVLSACGFLMGLAAEELEPAELEHLDPYHPLLICVRAEKPEAAPAPRPRPAAHDAKAIVLLYHRIDPPGARDRWSLCVSPRHFEAQMRWLRERFELVRVSELPGMLAERRLPRRAAAVTFDDGYRDNWTVAAPILRELGVPATFFLSGDAAIVGESFWWEILDDSLAVARLDDEAARVLHRRLTFAGNDERRRVLSDLPRGRGRLPAPLSGSEVAKLACEPFAEIGYHGWSHRVLAGLPPDLQRHEVSENMKTLREVAGRTVRCFAYPFGGPVSVETRQLLGELGIEAAATTEEAAVTVDSDPLALPRVAIGDWPQERFARRVAEILDG